MHKLETVVGWSDGRSNFPPPPLFILFPLSSRPLLAYPSTYSLLAVTVVLVDIGILKLLDQVFSDDCSSLPFPEAHTEFPGLRWPTSTLLALRSLETAGETPFLLLRKG